MAGGSAGVSQTTVSSSSVAEVTKLFVYGESDESIRTALRRFEDLVKDKFTRKKIEDKCIQNMTEDELNCNSYILEFRGEKEETTCHILCFEK